MPPRQPAPRSPRKGRTRLGPSEGDATARRLLAARSRQSRASDPVSPEPPADEAPAGAATAGAAAAPAALATEPTAPEPVLPEPVLPEPVGSEPVGSEPVGEEGDGRGRLPRLAILLGVATVVFGCLAAWFGTEASNANNGTDTQNTALTDPSATSVVAGQIATEVGTLFSYNYIDPQPTLSAASRDLTGSAVTEYASLFSRVRQLAPQDQLIVSMSVTSVGVELLTGSTARLLVFGRESDRHASQAAGTPQTAMLAVNAVRVGSQWKISGINPTG